MTEEFIEVPSGRESIRIGFTDQKVSGRAGVSTFTAFLRFYNFSALLERVLPARDGAAQAGRGGRPAQPAAEVALGFLVGLLCGAQRLTHVAWLRGDALLQRLLAVTQLPSQSTLSRFLALFRHAGICQRAFTPLWRWAMERLPSRSGGYTLDLDSTRLLHEDGHQEGVAVGYTRFGYKPCLHPLLAVLEEAKLVVGFWLRPGNTSCAHNILAFTLELLQNLPHHVRLRLVRADSGFCQAPWLALLESQGLRYIIAAALRRPVQKILRKETTWHPSSLKGTEVGEVWHQEKEWAQPRRLIVIRHRLAEKKRGGGKLLFDEPAFGYQAFVTNLPQSVRPLEVWRDYNGRAGCEGVIKQLDADFALDKLCLKKFFATEAALSLAVVAYNLCLLFQRHLGWQDRSTAATLRYRLFTTAGIISQTGGRTTIRLAVPVAERDWWRNLYEKIIGLFPNCHAIPQTPP